MATNVKITHIEDTRANITSSKRASMLAYDTTNDTLAYVKQDGTTERNILTMDSTNSTLYALGDFQYADESWIGLGGSAGRITFNDEGTDNLHIEDADLVLDLDVEFVKDVDHTIQVAAGTTTGSDLYIRAADGTGVETAGGDLYLKAGRENGDETGYEKIYFNTTDSYVSYKRWIFNTDILDISVTTATFKDGTEISSAGLIVGGYIRTGTGGYDVYTASAEDLDLLTATSSAGNGKLWWDDSEYSNYPFTFSKGVTFSAGFKIAESIGEWEYIYNDAGAAQGPIVRLTRDSASPAASDVIAGIIYEGRNSIAGDVEYVTGKVTITNATSGSECGKIVWGAIGGSSLSGRTLTLEGTATGLDLYTEAWTDYYSTSTVVGFSSSSGYIYYKIIGATVFVSFDIIGTSNATTFTFTLPKTARNSPVDWMFPIKARDDTTNLSFAGRGYVGYNTNLVTLETDWDSAGWTNTGSKGASGTFFFEYA